MCPTQRLAFQKDSSSVIHAKFILCEQGTYRHLLLELLHKAVSSKETLQALACNHGNQGILINSIISVNKVAKVTILTKEPW